MNAAQPAHTARPTSPAASAAPATAANPANSPTAANPAEPVSVHGSSGAPRQEEADPLSAGLERLDAVSRAAMDRLVRPALPAREPELAAALRAAPRHRALLRRWLATLCRAGLLARDPDGTFRAAAPAPPYRPGQLADAYAALGFPPEMARYHRAALDRLPDLLSDRISAQHLLFTGPGHDAAHGPEAAAGSAAHGVLGAYQRNVFTAWLNDRCGQLARTAVARRGRRARVVELGGGAGVTTEAVLGALAGAPRLCPEYLFTDVSRLFTAAAERIPGVRTTLLDIDADFPAQGFADGSADVVIAGNVLHNAADLPATLRRTRRLLYPGGELLVLDSVRDTDAVLTSLHFLLSPPAGSEHADDPRTRFADRRSGTDDVFPDAAAWREELTGAGFTVCATLPPEGSPYAAAGQLLWHATADPEPRDGSAGPSRSARPATGLRFADAEPDAVVCEIDGTAYRADEVERAVHDGGPAGVPHTAREFFAAVAAVLTASPPLPAVGTPGTPPPCTAVLAGDRAGARAAVETWARGGRVVCAAPDIPAARLLALLERDAVTEAVLPLSSVRTLPREPAAVLTDLSTLARVRCTGGEPTAQDTEAWAGLGPAPEAEPSGPAPEAELSGPAPDGSVPPGGEHPVRNGSTRGGSGRTVGGTAGTGGSSDSAGGGTAGTGGYGGTGTGTEAGEPGAGRREAVAGRGEPDAGPDSPVTLAAAAGDAALDGVDQQAAVAAAREVDRAALHTMLGTLRRAGCFTSSAEQHTEAQIRTATGAAPAHHRLLRRWLTVLTAEGLLEEGADGAFRRVPGPETGTAPDRVWERARRRWLEVYGAADTVDHARRCAEELPALLRGEHSAARLLFPEGGLEHARALYRESATARYQHHAAAELAAAHLRARSGAGRPHVLEAGGGTGTTTEVLLPALHRLPGPPVDYLFTDVSPFFLGHARERFGDRVRYGLLDIDGDPLDQGHRPGEADVVVAGGVLNAAVDTDASVRGLARLLTPGGLLVLTEPTTEEYWVLVTQGFSMAAPRDARAATGASFLTRAQWLAVLDGAGLRPVADLPGPGHPLEPLGHRVFAARAPGTR